MKIIAAVVIYGTLTLSALAQDDEIVTNSAPVVTQVHVIRAIPSIRLNLDDKEVIGRAVQVDTNLNVHILWQVPDLAGAGRTMLVEEKVVRKNFAWFLNQIGSTQTVNQAIKNLRRGIQKEAKD